VRGLSRGRGLGSFREDTVVQFVRQYKAAGGNECVQFSCSAGFSMLQVSKPQGESVCCLLILNSVTSTPQWIRQSEAAWLSELLTRSFTRSSPSRHPPFTQYPFPSRSLVRDGHTSPHMPRLVVPHSTCPSLSPSPPRTQFYNRSCSNKHTTPAGDRPLPSLLATFNRDRLEETGGDPRGFCTNRR
jgi:hypothetical protein